MKNESIVIAGYYGFGNAGDELILCSLIRTFRRENPDREITVLSNNPAETISRFEVKSLNRWKPLSWFPVFFHAERFILGGGGLLQESTGPWNHAYYLSLVALAKIFGCRTEALSMGIDPIQNPINRLWTRWVMNHWLDFLSVRDEESRKAAEGAGVRRPIEIHPDPVFELMGEASGLRNGVAFVLSPMTDHPHWSQEMADLCDRLSERLHAPIDLLVFFPDEDAALARDIARRSSAVREIRLWKNPKDLLSWIASYQLVAASRFHALVLAAISGVPFVGFGPQNKVAALCRKQKMPCWNGEGKWDVERLLTLVLPLSKTENKSVILETRIG